MKSALFPVFAGELRNHPAPGYHENFGQLESEISTGWFLKWKITPPQSYLKFLEEFGTGRFFGGSLVLFPLEGSQATVVSITEKLPENEQKAFFAFGYDGTTEGCYCLDRHGKQESVFWHNWMAKTTALHHKDFCEWIESLPAQLFSSQTYAGYTGIRDVRPILEIIEERKAFEIRLLSYDKKLVRPPGKEKDLLPRYNRLVLGVTKKQESWLKEITIQVYRSGTSIREKNVEYLTLNLDDLVTGKEQEKEAFVFDPFNLPFSEISMIHSPNIDLGSKMRVRFSEIKKYL